MDIHCLALSLEPQEDVMKQKGVFQHQPTPKTIDEYDIYSRIEQHIDISLSLYQVNKQGQEVVSEILLKKLKLKEVNSQSRVNNKGKKQLALHALCNDDIRVLYETLADIVNFNRTSMDTYTSLLCMLDDSMFNESSYIETFYVGEAEYSLESLYYKQETWINELEWHERSAYTFNSNTTLDLGECSHVLLFLNNYQDVVYKIKKHLNSYDKLMTHVDKIINKIGCARDIMYNMVEEHLKEG